VTAPEDDPIEHHARLNGALLAWFEWRADLAGREPSILLVHATGFHARVWDQMISHMPGRHIVSLDQRGHGRSEKVRIESWRTVGEDLVAWIDAVGAEGAIGVGHSMGGHAMTHAAANRPAAFARLTLVDPVVADPAGWSSRAWKTEDLHEGQHPTVKRKNHFASPEAMIERFANRSPYSLFEPEALRDYCVHGLLPAPDGDGYVLACPPEIEASVYMTSRTHPGIYDDIARVQVPVTVLRAQEHSGDGGAMDFASSPTWPKLAEAFPNGRDVYLPELTHFMPMQAPRIVADYVLGRAP
jgi:pimeloyl-ACP methyl ester carboxylesterase